METEKREANPTLVQSMVWQRSRDTWTLNPFSVEKDSSLSGLFFAVVYLLCSHPPPPHPPPPPPPPETMPSPLETWFSPTLTELFPEGLLIKALGPSPDLSARVSSWLKADQRLCWVFAKWNEGRGFVLQWWTLGRNYVLLSIKAVSNMWLLSKGNSECPKDSLVSRKPAASLLLQSSLQI
jgi:hypothetical protein